MFPGVHSLWEDPSSSCLDLQWAPGKGRLFRDIGTLAVVVLYRRTFGKYCLTFSLLIRRKDLFLTQLVTSQSGLGCWSLTFEPVMSSIKTMESSLFKYVMSCCIGEVVWYVTGDLEVSKVTGVGGGRLSLCSATGCNLWFTKCPEQEH